MIPGVKVNLRYFPTNSAWFSEKRSDTSSVPSMNMNSWSARCLHVAHAELMEDARHLLTLRHLLNQKSSPLSPVSGVSGVSDNAALLPWTGHHSLKSFRTEAILPLYNQSVHKSQLVDNLPA